MAARTLYARFRLPQKAATSLRCAPPSGPGRAADGELGGREQPGLLDRVPHGVRADGGDVLGLQVRVRHPDGAGAEVGRLSTPSLAAVAATASASISSDSGTRNPLSPNSARIAPMSPAPSVSMTDTPEAVQLAAGEVGDPLQR